ncbi:MAG: phosphatase PAP2 family protein [Caldilineaceae bacterium]|nr:phosphatase PAP2 family protein [Caldilineaceae bacterium]
MSPLFSSLFSFLTSFLSPLDESISAHIALDESQRNWRNPLFWLANVGAHLGDSLLWAGITALLWRKAGDDPARKRLLSGWMAAFAGAVFVTLAIKRVFRRPRPGTGQMLYGPGADQHSFPSGHGARVGVILVWAEALWPGAGWLAPLIGLWIGWARVAMGIHYAGDVLAGVALGWGVGRLAQKGVWGDRRRTDE